MCKLASLSVAFALVAVGFYGCDETNPTEPDGADGILLSTNGGSAGLSSTFDSGNEGWTLVGDAYRTWTGSWIRSLYPEHDPSGGNPGGAVFAIDMAKGMYYYWQAPPRYLGNQFGAYGGVLQYDVRAVGSGNPTHATDVIMAGGDITLVIKVDPAVGAAWTTVTHGLTEVAGWRHEDPLFGQLATADDLKEVLKDLTVLLIRGEYLDLADTGYLDNVRLVPSGQVK